MTAVKNKLGTLKPFKILYELRNFAGDEMKEVLDHPALSLVRDAQDELGVCLPVEKKIEGNLGKVLSPSLLISSLSTAVIEPGLSHPRKDTNLACYPSV